MASRTDSGRFCFQLSRITGSLFERMFLVQKTIDRARHESGKRGIAATLDAVARETESKTDWADLVTIYKRLRSETSVLPREDFLSGLAILGIASRRTLRLHQYLSLLPTEEAPKTILTGLRLSMQSEYDAIRPTALMLPELNYYEFDLTSILSRDSIFPALVMPAEFERKVIRLSGSDIASPLCWPIAFHEFGHAIADRHGLADSAGYAASSTDPLVTLQRQYYGEFFADAVAARAVGPSGALALIRLQSMLFTTGRLPGPSASHPSVLARVDAVAKLLGEEAMRPFAETIEEERWLSAQLLQNPKEIALFAHIDQNICPPIADRAAADAVALPIRGFDAGSVLRSHRLADRLLRGVPPAGIRWVEKAIVRPEIEAATNANDAERFRQGLRLMAERAASPGEVFTAGYLRLENDLPPVLDSILSTAPTTWREWVSPVKGVFDRDELLMAALQTIEIHHFLVEHSEAAGDSLTPPDPGPLPVSAGEGDTTPMVGGILTDSQIALRMLEPNPERRVYVTPLVDPLTQIGPASIDIRLGADALVFTNVNFTSLDPLLPEEQAAELVSRHSRTYEITPDSPLILHPGEFALAASFEYLRLPPDLACRLEGRSSYGRGGLLVHATAGFIDPGYRGRITLELTNLGKVPLPLYPGTRIGQLCFFGAQRTMLSYGAKHERKYSGALRTLASRYFQDREFRWYRAKSSP